MIIIINRSDKDREREMKNWIKIDNNNNMEPTTVVFTNKHELDNRQIMNLVTLIDHSNMLNK